MKSLTFRRNSRQTVRAIQPAAQPRKRSQLIENTASKHMEVFQTWLLHIGATPKAGLPASQIGMYTDFN